MKKQEKNWIFNALQCYNWWLALKQLKKLDRNTGKKIWNFIESNLNKCENPRLYGKALTGNHKGKWRYRVGDYRILALIKDKKVEILVIEVGHRKKIYK